MFIKFFKRLWLSWRLYLIGAVVAGALLTGAYAKGWIDRGRYEAAMGAKKTVKQVKVKNEIRNRPRDVDAVIERLRRGTF